MPSRDASATLGPPCHWREAVRLSERPLVRAAMAWRKVQQGSAHGDSIAVGAGATAAARQSYPFRLAVWLVASRLGGLLVGRKRRAAIRRIGSRAWADPELRLRVGIGIGVTPPGLAAGNAMCCAPIS